MHSCPAFAARERQVLAKVERSGGNWKVYSQWSCSSSGSDGLFAQNRSLRSIVILVFFAPAFLLGGCVSPPPLSDFERSLYTDEPQKASIVIYRSTGESWIDKPIPALIHIDGAPFARLLGGEYIKIYLSGGQHGIEVKYYRDCELEIAKAVQTIILTPQQTLYLQIVPSFGGMTWIFCSPFQLVPIPMIGSAVKLFLREEEDALGDMGKAVDEELLKTRRITH